MAFEIINSDITEMKCDAIVNAANKHLAYGGGVCGTIFKKAGINSLNNACQKIGYCPTGGAVITPGFNLDAKYVIHAVGPIYLDGKHNEEKLLFSAYQSALKLAVDNNCKSIAFPLISSGIYGYPVNEAKAVAIKAIKDFLQDHEIDVYLVLFR